MAVDSVYRAFGEAVSTRRNELKLTQARLASKVKMSRASIANIESGRQNVLLHHVYALAAALDFPKVADLLPPLPQKPVGEDIKMTMPNQETLSQNAEAQVADLITTALAPRRTLKARS